MSTYSIKAIRDEFKAKGIFYTPPELVEFMMRYIPEGFKPSCVYDPTCGHGALLRKFSDDVKKYGQDINEIAVNACQDINNADVRLGNTLSEPAFINERFDLIFANPPFSIPWERIHYDWIPKDIPALPPKSKADYAFILHCLHCLADEGVAIIINLPGILYRGQSEGKIRKWLIENNYIERVVHIEGKKFEDTAIATVLLVLRKNKTDTDIIFEDEKQEKKVPVQDVIDNNFNLSVSNYILYEEEKEVVDPIEIEMKASNALLNHVNASLEMSFTAWKFMGGVSIEPLLERLENLIKSWRKRIVDENN